MAKASGSSNGCGALPIVPVRYSDHGSMVEAYRASDDGRTWKIIAFNFNCTARSSNEISSAFCSATLRPGLDGQSLLATVTSHAPRNSRTCLLYTSDAADDLL